AALDPTQFRDHDRWLRIMMASHSATNGEGMDEFLEWSCSDPTYTNDRTQIAKRWDTLHDSGPSSSVTALTLFKELKDAGRGARIPQGPTSEDDFSDDAGEPGSADGWLARLNRDHYAITAGKFRVLRRVPDPIVGRYAWATSSRQDFEAAYANRKVECAGP